MRALVVFYDPDDARYKWLLKPGFRHVFACVDDGDYWIMFDPRDGRPVVQALKGSNFNMARYFEGQGYTVVEIEQGPPIRAPLSVANCVGMIKALLGIRAPFAQTPYGLFCHLRGSP